VSNILIANDKNYVLAKPFKAKITSLALKLGLQNESKWFCSEQHRSLLDKLATLSSFRLHFPDRSSRAEERTLKDKKIIEVSQTSYHNVKFSFHHDKICVTPSQYEWLNYVIERSTQSRAAGVCVRDKFKFRAQLVTLRPPELNLNPKRTKFSMTAGCSEVISAS
jgi:hypothetical protein